MILLGFDLCHLLHAVFAVQGCIELLERSGVTISGKRAVVVGRSNIVGLPAALLLQNRDATVTMVHSRTPNAQQIAAEADILIAACGKAEYVTGAWVKPGAAVVDVGINAVRVMRCWGVGCCCCRCLYVW